MAQNPHSGRTKRQHMWDGVFWYGVAAVIAGIAVWATINPSDHGLHRGDRYYREGSMHLYPPAQDPYYTYMR